jgi:hypothetical protein
MSVVLYSPRGKSNIEEEAYNVFDETFASTTDLLSYQVGNYIIVVFEDMGNNIEVLLKLLRTHSTFGDHLLQSLQGSFSFLIYDRVIKK